MGVLFETLEEGTNIWSAVLKIKYGEDPQVSVNVSWTNENNGYTHEMWVLDASLGPYALRKEKERMQRKQLKGCKGLNIQAEE